MRGALGKGLFGSSHYHRLFAPEINVGKPSGLRTPPRPFTLRPSLGSVHVFSGAADARLIAAALGEPDARVIEIPFDLRPEIPAAKIRIEFKSPTILKGAARNGFAPIFARARDRVSTLRAFYGEGPLPIDFRALGDAAGAIETASRAVLVQEVFRRSGRTGQIHPIGGFTGTIEFTGDLRPFTPILTAAQYTGIGSKVSWGNGWYELTILKPVRQDPARSATRH